MKYYSHIKRGENGKTIGNKYLKEHLQNVANNIKTKIEETVFNEKIDKEHLSKIGFLLGLYHDFGKYTTYFQNWLLDKKDSGDKKNHSLLSALFSFYAISSYKTSSR